MRKSLGLVALVLFIATIWIANLLIETYGIVGVGFGFAAPAGVFAVGIAFTLRDIVHRSLGTWAVLGAVVVGAVLSYTVSPAFALASGVAFLVSELADLTVYTPLRQRSWTGAVIASNVVGAVVDSFIFLTLAFHSTQFLTGQIVGKLWMTAGAVVLIAVFHGVRQDRNTSAAFG